MSRASTGKDANRRGRGAECSHDVVYLGVDF